MSAPDTTAPSWADLVARTRIALAGGGIESAALEARLLAAAALRTDPVGLLLGSGNAADAAAVRLLASYAERRLGREPVGRILGCREFWGLPFRLGPDTLEPRPDTETVVEAALAALAGNTAPRVLDLGTGTGCILTALLHEMPPATGIGLDRSEAALRLARANAEANGVGARAAFVCGDWADALAGRFDLVVSNPPYIPAGTVGDLAPDVARFDPRLALDGGRDGLDAYRTILEQLPRLLATGGRAVFEIGYDQAEAVGSLADLAGFEVQAVRRDLGGHERAVTLVQRHDVA